MATQLRFDVTALDQASKTFARMAQAVERFEKRLDAIDGKRIQAQVEVDTDQAEREVGRFATDLRRTIGAAIDSLPEIDLTADSSDAERKLAEIRRRMQELSDKRIGVDLSAEAALAEAAGLQRELDQLARTSPEVQVRVDAAAAAAKLADIQTQVGRLDGRTARIKVDTDRSVSSTLVQVAQLGRALAALAVPAGLVAGLPQIASLGSTAVQAAGALALIPAAATAAALGVGALAVGFGGFADALGDNPQKAAEALAKMPAPARDTVAAIRSLTGAWDGLRLDVQARLFTGLGVSVRQLGGTYLPVLRGGLGGIAGGFNLAGTSVAAFMSRASTVRDWQGIVTASSGAVQALSRAFAPLVSVMTDLGAVGAPILRQLSIGAADAAVRFAAFVARARETGQLGAWMQRGVDVLRQLGQIAVNVGASLLSIFRAANSGATPFVTTLEQATARMRAFLASAEGQARMAELFNGIRASVGALAPLLTALAVAAGNVAPHLHSIGLALLALRAGGSVVGVIALLAAAFPPLISALSELAPLIPVVAGALIGLRIASTLAPAFRDASGGVNTFLGSIRSAGTVGAGFRAALTGITGALGGPFGIALMAAGVALGLLAQRQQEAAQAAQAHKARLDEVTGSLDPYTGAVTKQTASIIANQLAQDGSIASLERLQVNTQTYTEAMTGNRAAIQAVTGQLHEQTRSAIQASDSYRMMKPYLDQYGVSLDDVALAAEGNVDANNQVTDALRRSGIATNEGGDASAYMAGQLYEAGGASAQLQGRLNETVGALERQRSALQSAAAAASDFGRELENVRPGFEALAQGASITPELQSGFDRLADAARRNAQSVGENAIKFGNVATAGQAASNAMQQSRDQFVGAATAAGMTEKAAAELADRLGLIPAKTRTDFETNAKTTVDQITQINNQLRALPPGRQITIDALTGPAETSLSALGIKVERLKDGKVRVTAETAEARANLDLFMRGANERRAQVVIDGQTQPANMALATVLGQIAQGKGMVNIDGNPQPAQQVLAYLMGSIGGVRGEVQIGATRAPADQVLQAYLAAVRSGNPQVQVGANALPADQVLAALTAQIRQPGTKPIDGDPGPFVATLAGAVGAAATTKAVIGIDGNPALFRGQVLSGVGFANGQRGTITIDGDPGSANGKTTAAVRFANGSRGMIVLDGNQAPVNGKVTAAVRYADGSRGTITVDARDLATPKINAIPKTGTTVWTIKYVTVGAAPAGPMSGSVQMRAAGGYAIGRASGAYVAPAAYALGGLRSMSAARAEIVPARQPRIIGDRMQGDEAFIPVNQSIRSLSILATTANAMGRVAVPKEMLAGLAASRSLAGGPAGYTERINLGTDPAAMLSAVRTAAAVSAAAMTASAARQAAALAGLRGDLDRLRSEMRAVAAAVREARPITVMDQSGDPVETARAAQLLLRL